MKSHKKSYMRKQKSAPYLFIAPFYILFATFMVYPIIFSLKASLTSWNGVQAMKWVGLGNYVKLIHDKVFLQALANGVIMFFMYVPFMLIMALLLAVILNRPRQKFKSFFRMAYFIPNITCVVAIAYVFLLMFDTKYGLVNKGLMSIGIPAIRWFGSAFGARLVIGILVTWKYMGYNMILMMAGLQTIDESLIEAAKIDGAGSIKVFTKITIPLMRPVILFTTVLSTMGTFSLFSEPLIMTNGGGPLYKTMSCVLYIYTESFQHLKMGYASALAYAFFLIMIFFTFIQFKLNERIEKN